MAQTVEVKIALADLPVVKAELERLYVEVAEWKAEAEVWEERYETLLAEVGGVWPT